MPNFSHNFKNIPAGIYLLKVKANKGKMTEIIIE